jgi:cysteine synthase A
MPETMSLERRMMLMALGCEVVLTPKEKAVSGAIAKAKEIIEELNGDGFMLQQFENPANAKVHRETTGPEIWKDTDGTIDLFFSGVGTGGTYYDIYVICFPTISSADWNVSAQAPLINEFLHYSSFYFIPGTVTGVSQYIKGCSEFGLPPLKPELKTIAVEPEEQMLLTEKKGGEKRGPQGPHKIQGMGAGIIPDVIDLDLVDEIVAIHSDKAMETCKEMWMMGVPVGVSAGAIAAAALEVCGRPENANKVAVCIVPSFGERYFTHPMFDQIREDAANLKKQPLPEPFDNTEFGFPTARG